MAASNEQGAGRVALPGGPGRQTAAAPLVATKLAPPTLPRAHRERERLSRLLDAALDEAIRLTLVSAPPGYGKSTAVAGWLTSRGPARAWLSLDAADNDPVRFVQYLVAALRIVRPGAGGAVLGLVAAGATPGAELLGATIVEAIATSEEPFVLVLDDYHVIDAPLIHELMRFLVERTPPFAHIVLVTRQDPSPPLPLARLRAHGRLAELRGADLRYSDDEAASFLGDVIGAAPGSGSGASDPAIAARLADRAEGWAAALQLAGLALRDRSDAPSRTEALAGGRRAVFDYLADEVLSDLDDDLRGFLIRTSIADRFTVELCVELTARDDAAALLNRAEQANLFLEPVGPEGHWVRYHALFAAYLRSFLADDEARTLHARAADYLERIGLEEEAITHALAADDLDRATRLMERQARPSFESGRLLSLLVWTSALPPERVAARPDLASYRGWALLFTGQVGEAIACAAGVPDSPTNASARTRMRPSAADAGSPTQVRPSAATSQSDRTGRQPGQADLPGRGRLLALRAVLATVGEQDAEDLAAAAFERLGDDHFFRAIAHLALGMERWTKGDPAAGLGSWWVAFDTALLAGQPMAIALATTALASGLHDTGALREAETLSRRVLAEHGGSDGRPQPMAWFVRMPLGQALYERNDLVESRRELERGFEGAGVFGFGRVLAGFAVGYLALARNATGSPEAALDVVRSTSRALTVAGVAANIPSEIEARLRLSQGDLETAARWADAASPVPGSEPLPFGMLIARDATIARVRLAQGRPADALHALARGRAVAGRTGMIPDLISNRVLESVALEAAGDRAGALRALAEAVRLAAPEGFVRRFVDDGERAGHLLPYVRREAPDFVDVLVAALSSSTVGAPRAHGASLWQDAQGDLLETLTGRELEVLRRMAAGASNAEIAASLGMSTGTARWHVGNILSKLGARSRTRAVLRAQRLGLV